MKNKKLFFNLFFIALVAFIVLFINGTEQCFASEKISLKNNKIAAKDINEKYSNTAPIKDAPTEQEVHDYKCTPDNQEECLKTNPIVRWLNVIVNLVASIVGLGAVLMVIWAGIQYTTARDNAQAVAAAKQKIINVVIGIAAFIFLYAFLNWLVPGGVFK